MFQIDFYTEAHKTKVILIGCLTNGSLLPNFLLWDMNVKKKILKKQCGKQ